MQQQHVNVYGPMASGKTRNAEALRKHFKCDHVVDEGVRMLDPGPTIQRSNKGRFLVLTQEPVQHPRFKNVRIDVALAEIEGARHGRG